MLTTRPGERCPGTKGLARAHRLPDRQSQLEPPVGDDGFGGEEVAEGAEVGEVEDLGEAVVEGLAGGAVGHGGETLEFGGEEVGECLKLGCGEAGRVEDGQVREVGLLYLHPTTFRSIANCKKR